MRVTFTADTDDGLEQYKSGLTYDVPDERGRMLVLLGRADAVGNTSRKAPANGGAVGAISAVGANAGIASAMATGVGWRTVFASGDSSGATDLSAIQAALTACGDAGGGKVLLGIGTFYLNARVSIPSNVELCGAGKFTVLKATANAIDGLVYSMNTDSIVVRDLAIDGGGQTSDVYTGIAAVKGIRFDGVTRFRISGVHVYKCGVANQAAPATDSAHAGLGILIAPSSTQGSEKGAIEHCYIRHIASGGNSNGDGIEIAGAFSGAAGRITRYIEVRNCVAELCGRHGFSASGDSTYDVPRDIRFVDCTAISTGLCGLDCEDAENVVVTGCSFISCGNDQTYYNPASVYGATYRLLAGVATGNASNKNIVVQGCHFKSCYYSLTYGATAGMRVEGCRGESATTADIHCTLASTPGDLRMAGCAWESTAGPSTVAMSQTSSAGVVSDCVFAARVYMTGCVSFEWIGCSFKAGFRFTGGGSKIHFIGCHWSDFVGSGVDFSTTNLQISDVTFTGCTWRGAGNLVHGVAMQWQTCYRWSFVGCVFDYIPTGDAINLSNGGGMSALAAVIGCSFRQLANGIKVVVNGIQDGVIQGNRFSDITSWALDFSGIASSNDMRRMTIANNVATTSVANGIRVAVTTGAWDYCVNTGNNWSACTGTKSSLSAGNASGATANNLTT